MQVRHPGHRAAQGSDVQTGTEGHRIRGQPVGLGQGSQFCKQRNSYCEFSEMRGERKERDVGWDIASHGVGGSQAGAQKPRVTDKIPKYPE